MINTSFPVSASAKTHDFDHLIEHTLSCTSEKDGEDVSNGSELVVGMINEMVDVERLRLH